MGRDQEHQLGAVALKLAAAKQRAQNGNLAQQWHARHHLAHIVLDQAGNGQALAVHELHRGLHAVGGEVGQHGLYGVDLEARALAKVGNLRRHLQVNATAIKHGGGELDAHAVLALIKGKGSGAARWHRNKQAPACQKTGLLAADGNDVGLGQHLDQGLVLVGVHPQAVAVFSRDAENAVATEQVGQDAVGHPGRSGGGAEIYA